MGSWGDGRDNGITASTLPNSLSCVIYNTFKPKITLSYCEKLTLGVEVEAVLRGYFT
ncbi:hypothetical protein ACE1CI_09090 [Aerosakkonemataceae cyanobacterium BLCC-F50]|uniref:Uncharacterized protein n=1 Tax=Floridaenema flaviceps BLCC-F50 TaxID=3153642 RepID=A0ABV4XMW8_9CYAN